MKKILVYTEEMESHQKIKKLLQTPNEIMEIFKALIYAKDNLQTLCNTRSQKKKKKKKSFCLNG